MQQMQDQRSPKIIHPNKDGYFSSILAFSPKFFWTISCGMRTIGASTLVPCRQSVVKHGAMVRAHGG